MCPKGNAPNQDKSPQEELCEGQEGSRFSGEFTLSPNVNVGVLSACSVKILPVSFSSLAHAQPHLCAAGQCTQLARVRPFGGLGRV